jgi:hypothetical protein
MGIHRRCPVDVVSLGVQCGRTPHNQLLPHGPLLEFEAEFDSPDFLAEHSLLLSYQAALPHFERAVLPGLQRGGAGSVVVLVDRADYQASFANASAVSRVGVDYAFEGLKLPGRSARFHGKCFLLLKPHAARLYIGSANLTATGLRTNLEIVDRLTVIRDPHRLQGDVSVMRTFSDLLGLLLEVSPTTNAAALRRLAVAQAKLDALLDDPDAAVDDTSVVLLHTISHSLLGQITRQIPTASVDQITAMSRIGRALSCLSARSRSGGQGRGAHQEPVGCALSAARPARPGMRT